MPCSATELQRNRSCRRLWKKSMKQTCIDWFRQRVSHRFSKNELWVKAGCSFEQRHCCLDRKCSLPRMPSYFQTVITYFNAKPSTKWRYGLGIWKKKSECLCVILWVECLTNLQGFTKCLLIISKITIQKRAKKKPFWRLILVYISPNFGAYLFSPTHVIAQL